MGIEGLVRSRFFLVILGNVLDKIPHPRQCSIGIEGAYQSLA